MAHIIYPTMLANPGIIVKHKESSKSTDLRNINRRGVNQRGKPMASIGFTCYESSPILESWFSPKQAGEARKTRNAREDRLIGESCTTLPTCQRDDLPPASPEKGCRKRKRSYTEDPRSIGTGHDQSVLFGMCCNTGALQN